MLKKTLIALFTLSIATGVLLAVLPAELEKSMNIVVPHERWEISEPARKLHAQLQIGDLHSDSTLWKRDLLERSDRGHVDIPRMREGNVAVQMFTSVTKSPAGQNYQRNATDARDNITLAAISQRWPTATWNNLTERALYQAGRLHALQERGPEEFSLILKQSDLSTLLSARAAGSPIVGGVLGTEGSHALEGSLDNIAVLYEAGFRMMSLQHFFDNALGGSLHGESGDGLTTFGRQAVNSMQQQGIMVDVSHSSEQVVRDVLQLSTAPLIVSHTGFYGHCESHRNISDELMQAIARAGGLIGVGFWDAAVCDPSPAGIVAAIRYGIDLVGVDHVALGSDYDGSIAAYFDISELAVLTHEMLLADFTKKEIRQVMGGNMMRFMAENLPPG